MLTQHRRALISQRIAHVSSQTDPIPTKDQQVETDGSVTIKKESPGGCNANKPLHNLSNCKVNHSISVILTQTIGITTDDILINEIGTQTARPKTSLSFATFPYKSKSDNERQYGTVDNNILRNARSLQAQVHDLKRLEEQLWKKRNKVGPDDDTAAPDDDIKVEEPLWKKRNKVGLDDDTASEPNKEIIDDSRELEFSDDSLSDTGKTDFRCHSRPYSNDSYDIMANDVQENFLNAPTLTSWTGFDSNDDDDYDLPELPKKTVSEGHAPWRNFKDILIGNR